jgi:hypothetical protein
MFSLVIDFMKLELHQSELKFILNLSCLLLQLSFYCCVGLSIHPILE